MKILIFLAIACFLFMFVFIQSQTWQARVVTEYRGEDEYLVTKHSVDWNRFLNYLKGLPAKALNSYYWLKSTIDSLREPTQKPLS